MFHYIHRVGLGYFCIIFFTIFDKFLSLIISLLSYAIVPSFVLQMRKIENIFVLQNTNFTIFGTLSFRTQLPVPSLSE